MKVSGWFRSVLVAAVVLLTTSLYAQATRTWVSGVGDDANPCSRTAPCKTWAGAISKTATGGIIDALDPGGYGAVTITKAITLEGNGTLASTLASGTNGVVINIAAGPTNRNVVLRNILIDGSGTTLGVDGVRFLSGDSLEIYGCSIEQFSGDGIEWAPNSAAKLTVRDTVITQVQTNGVLLKPSTVAAQVSRASIHNSTITRNQNGIRAEDFARLTLYDSRVTGNVADGVHAFSALGAGLIVFIENTEISGNGTGLRTTGGNAIMRVAKSNITTNTTGLAAGAGELSTCQNNTLNSNDANGTFTGNTVTCNQ